MRRIERKRFFAWQALLSPFAPCRRSGQRVAVQVLYTRFYLDFQGKSGIPGPSRTYPELFALMGGKLPDLRGLFLRGHGGSSAGLGTKQGESVYIAPGSAEASVAAGLTTIRVADGAGTSSDDQGRPKPSYNVLAASKNDSPGIGGNPRPQYEINGPISITSSANETRPVNQAVRYLVRARP